MANELTIRCACGAFQGVARDASSKTGNHLVCYCNDCQAFAKFLGRAPDVLDAQGGTEIFQMSSGNFAIVAGTERLACMRLTPRGLIRWYASCCNTPIGNTLATSKLPFVGLIHRCIQKPPACDSLEARLGPVLVRGFRKFAIGDTAKIPADKMPIPLLALRFIRLMLTWKLRGDRGRSVFFDPRSGQPIAAPAVLSAAERARLRAEAA